MGPAAPAVPVAMVSAPTQGGILWLGWCDPHPVRMLEVLQDFFVCECHHRLHLMLKLQHTFHQLVRFAWGWWLFFFHPMLEGFGISQGLLRLLQLIVLIAKSHVLEWQEPILVQGLGWWWWRVIILYFRGVASHLWYLKRHPHTSGEFPDVILAGNPQSSHHQTGISTCCMHQQIHPLCLWREGSGIVVCWGSSSTPLLAQGASPPVKNSWSQELRAGGHSRSSSSILGSGLDQSDGSPILSSSP